MLNELFLKRYLATTLIGGYALLLIYWLWIYMTGEQAGFHNFFWGLIPQAIIPVSFGIYGFFIAKKWGFFSSALGKAIIFLSGSNFMFGVGSGIWIYYTFIGVEVPYPSASDYFYALNIFFFILGLIYFGKGIGAGYKLRTPRGKATLFLAPVVVVLLTYVVFILIAQGGDFGFEDSTPLEIFINMYYLLGDVVILTVNLLIYSLSYKVLGGKFKLPTNILLVGALTGYVADALFTFREFQGTYYNADISDLLFTVSVSLSVLAVLFTDIKGVSSRIKAELAAFAPRTDKAVNNIASEIIMRQATIMGPAAWSEAMSVPGLSVDMKTNTLRVDGEPKVVLESLVRKYEEIFGQASIETCKSAAQKFIAQAPQEQIPQVLK